MQLFFYQNMHEDETLSLTTNGIALHTSSLYKNKHANYYRLMWRFLALFSRQFITLEGIALHQIKFGAINMDI